MEHTPWKPILVGAAASLILLLGIYLTVLPKSTELDSEKVEKIAEFKNSFAAGHEEGKKRWEFYAKYGWTGQNKDITNLEDVSKGKIFSKNGEILLHGLSAAKVSAYRYSKNIDAQGKEKAPLHTWIAISPKNKGKRKFAYVIAKELKYNHSAKITSLFGNITIKEKNFSLRAENVKIDHDQETAELSGNISAQRDDLTLTCKKLIYYSSNEKIQASDDVFVSIKGSSPARINADSILLYNDPGKDAELSGNIALHQGKKSAVANSAIYNKGKKSIDLRGAVKAVFEKGRNMIKAETTQKLKNPEAKKLLEEKTLLTSNRLVISTKTGDSKAYGNVNVTQKGSEAKSDEAIYSENQGNIILQGNVFLKKQNKWVKCEKVDVSIKDEVFEATGKVEGEFILEK